MTPYWYIRNNFSQSRSTHVGASEISAAIPDPEHPGQSLAGYDRTALTVWQEKTGRKERDSTGLAAEMGHWNEVKAIELFIRGINPDMAREYRRSRLEYERLSEQFPETRAEDYQTTPFRHNAQWYNDDFIVHPDGVYEPLGSGIKWEAFDEAGILKAHGYTIDLSRPFLIEAKTASYWAAKRRNGSVVHGYDFDLRTWQGIPLKHYVQIQFQLACLDVEVCYLPLLYDSASFHVWEIKRDRKVGDRLIDLAAKLAYYIHKDIEPKELAMNAADIASMYPTIAEDFAILSGPEASSIVQAASAYREGDELEKIGKQKKKDATDALAVYLKDTKELRVERDGEIVPVAAWIEKKGAERIIGLKEIRSMENGSTIEKYLTRKGLVKEGEGSRYVSVKWKED
jgi:hypothetical protein